MTRGSSNQDALVRRLGAAVLGLALVAVVALGPAAPAVAHLGLVAPPDLGRQTSEPLGPGRIGEPPGRGGTTTDPDRTTTLEDGTTTTTTDADAPTTTPEGDGGDRETGRPIGASDRDDGDDGTSVAVLAAVGFLGLVLGVLLAAIPLGLALARRKRPVVGDPYASGPPATSPASVPTPSTIAGGLVVGPPPSREEVQARSHRADLAEALMALRDQLPSEALSDEVGRALASVGIVEVRPDGQPFDPARHRAVDQVETDDPTRHGTVVSTERPGYADGDQIVRLPEVVVARHPGAPS